MNSDIYKLLFLSLIFTFTTVVESITYNYGDGSHYIGDVDQDTGRPVGYGRYYNKTKELEYEGEWEYGMMNGNGTWYGLNGETLEGEFVNNTAHGHVKHTTVRGDVYIGEFRNHRASGKGILIMNDGQRIEGQFKHGMVHGKATWIGPNGYKLEGKFRMGRPSGYCRLYDEEGNMIYDDIVDNKSLPVEIKIPYGLWEYRG